MACAIGLAIAPAPAWAGDDGGVPPRPPVEGTLWDPVKPAAPRTEVPPPPPPGDAAAKPPAPPPNPPKADPFARTPMEGTIWDPERAPTAREVQQDIEARMPCVPTHLCGEGEAFAGCGHGFGIRAGGATIHLGLTLQGRYEAFRWSEESAEPVPGGELSGFSFVRTTLAVDAIACWGKAHAVFEFGDSGSLSDLPIDRLNSFAEDLAFGQYQNRTPGRIELGTAREAWIEHAFCLGLDVRIGLFPTPATRQLMTPPEHQQFADVSLATSLVGTFLPGYTDRNRDYGVAAHGLFGADREFSFLFCVTNGDGPPRRNVFDGLTNDDLCYGARIDWNGVGALGYEEGARADRHPCWDFAAGLWAQTYHDVTFDHPHQLRANRFAWGVDAAARTGGWSMTAAYSASVFESGVLSLSTDDLTTTAWMVQAGYLFGGSRLEVAARYDLYRVDPQSTSAKFGASELGLAAIWHLDGDVDKVTADVSFVSSDADGNFQADVYAGYSVTGTSNATLFRLQWQLAL